MDLLILQDRRDQLSFLRKAQFILLAKVLAVRRPLNNAVGVCRRLLINRLQQMISAGEHLFLRIRKSRKKFVSRAAIGTSDFGKGGKNTVTTRQGVVLEKLKFWYFSSIN